MLTDENATIQEEGASLMGVRCLEDFSEPCSWLEGEQGKPSHSLAVYSNVGVAAGPWRWGQELSSSKLCRWEERLGGGETCRAESRLAV